MNTFPMTTERKTSLRFCRQRSFRDTTKPQSRMTKRGYVGK